MNTKHRVKMIYIFPSRHLDSKSSGIAKKVKMQKDVFVELGIDCEVEHILYQWNGKLEKIIRSVPFSNTFSKDVCKNVLKKIDENMDAVYIRHVLIDRSFFSLIKNIRKQAPTCKILFELPTYPYDKELPPVIGIPALMKDKFYRKRLKKYVDRIVVLGGEKEIFGIPTIKIDNGIDCADLCARVPVPKKDNVIRLLAVASVAKWHGYDRIIKGLGDYYQSVPNRIIEFHIVGDGNVLSDLKALCRTFNVEQYVFFHGWMNGQKLDDLFAQCDVGVGSLGMYRIGLESGNTLKLREYTARGIPFIYAYQDDVIDLCAKKYSFVFSNDDAPIDMERVIEFSDDIQKLGSEKVAYTMHQIAEENLSWRKQIKPVVDYIFLETSKKDLDNKG